MNGKCIDHINGNPLDNRKENIRVVTTLENMRNTMRYGFREGVSYDSTHDKYKAYLDQTDKKRINVGTFVTREQAEIALAKFKVENGFEEN